MKLHLGCGKRRIPGFVHVDLAGYPHVDYQCDVRYMPMISEESAELIYASHVLEYFNREEARDVLAEWRRVLQPGGILRLSVPDFEALWKVYNATRNIADIHGPLFGKWAGVLYHKTVYDHNSLSELLHACGFIHICPWDWRTTEHAQCDDFSQAYYPHMDKTGGILISLNLECERP